MVPAVYLVKCANIAGYTISFVWLFTTTEHIQCRKKRFMCLCSNQTVADHRRLNFQSHRGRYSRSIRSYVFVVSSLKLCLHKKEEEIKKRFMRLRSILGRYTIFLWFRFKTTRIPKCYALFFILHLNLICHLFARSR